MIGGKAVTPSEAKLNIEARVREKYEEGGQRYRVYENLLHALATSRAVKVEKLADYESRKAQGGEEFTNVARRERNRVAIVDRKNGLVLHLESSTEQGQFIQLDSAVIQI